MAEYKFTLGAAAWGLRETPLEKQYAICQELGLKELELSIGNGDSDQVQADADDKQLAQIAAWQREYGVANTCACTGCDLTVEEDELPAQIAHVQAVTACAAKAGCRYLRIFGGFNSDSVVYGQRRQRMLDALRQCAQFAAKCNVVLAVETHGGVAVNGDAVVHFHSPTTRVDNWQDILDTGCKMLVDPANLEAAGVNDPASFCRTYRNDVAYIHLKDFKRIPGGVTPVACGEGGLDWPLLMKEIGHMECPALVEYELPGDVADGLRRSKEFLQQL